MGGASGDGGEDVHVAVGGDGGVEAFEVADVATVEHHGDEAADLAGLVEDPRLEAGMFSDEARKGLGDGGRLRLKLNAPPADERAERGVEADLHAGGRCLLL